MKEYPNREHAAMDRAARRRIVSALSDIENEIRILRRKAVAMGDPRSTLDGDDTQVITEKVRDLTVSLSILGTLREVRAWHALDEASRKPS